MKKKYYLIMLSLTGLLNVAVAQNPPPATETWFHKILKEKTPEEVRNLLIEKSKVSIYEGEISAKAFSASPCSFCGNYFFTSLEKGSIELSHSEDLSFPSKQRVFLSESTKNNVISLKVPSNQELEDFINNNLGNGDHGLLHVNTIDSEMNVIRHEVNVVSINGKIEMYDVQYIAKGGTPIPLHDFMNGKSPNAINYQVQQIFEESDQPMVTFNIRADRSYTLSKKMKVVYNDNSSQSKVSSINVETSEDVPSEDLIEIIRRGKKSSTCTTP